MWSVICKVQKYSFGWCIYWENTVRRTQWMKGNNWQEVCIVWTCNWNLQEKHICVGKSKSMHDKMYLNMVQQPITQRTLTKWLHGIKTMVEGSQLVCLDSVFRITQTQNLHNNENILLIKTQISLNKISQKSETWLWNVTVCIRNFLHRPTALSTMRPQCELVFIPTKYSWRTT